MTYVLKQDSDYVHLKQLYFLFYIFCENWLTVRLDRNRHPKEVVTNRNIIKSMNTLS